MRILIVDDEPEILTIVSKWLAVKGHQAFKASDPDRALQIVESVDLQLVLLDLVMPKISGLSLIHRIHAKKPDLPLIVMSVIEDTRVAVLAAQEGVEGYLTKPIDFERLDELLKTL